MNMLVRLVPLLLLIGCSSPAKWYLGGRTQAEFQYHAAQCEEQASSGINQNALNQMGYATGAGVKGAGAGSLAMLLLESSAYDSRFEHCMRGYGYRKAR